MGDQIDEVDAKCRIEQNILVKLEIKWYDQNKKKILFLDQKKKFSWFIDEYSNDVYFGNFNC